MRLSLIAAICVACGGTVVTPPDAAPDVPGDTQTAVQNSGQPFTCPDIGRVTEACRASMQRWCVSGGFMSCPFGRWEYTPAREPDCEVCK